MSLPDFESPHFMEEVCRRKLSREDIYLLALHQILTNQAGILIRGSTNTCMLVDNTRAIIKRLEEFAKNKE